MAEKIQPETELFNSQRPQNGQAYVKNLAAKVCLTILGRYALKVYTAGNVVQHFA